VGRARKPNVATVLVVSPDERWMRVQVTIRLGYRPVLRRSVGDAVRWRGGRPPCAIADGNRYR
jgi:hypothetical protein